MTYSLISLLIFNLLFAQDKGLEAFNDGRFNDAKYYYENILKSRSDDSSAKFGLGVTAYEQKQMDDALKILNDMKNSSDLILSSKAYFNIGNILNEQQKYEESIGFYKKAIELDPNDKDAKINFELLKKLIQKQNQDEQNQDEQNQDEQNQDHQKDQKSNKSIDNDGKKTDNLIQAEAILDALRDQEQINQKRKINKLKTRRLEKDW